MSVTGQARDLVSGIFWKSRNRDPRMKIDNGHGRDRTPDLNIKLS